MSKKMHEAIQEFVLKKTVMLDQDSPYSKAACAKLRNAVAKPRGSVPDTWEITLHGSPEGDIAGEAIHTALTLYALHKQGKPDSMNDGKTGFGSAIAKLVTEDNEQAVRRRFNAVATSLDFSEMAYHARGLVQLLRSKDIKMNYAQFASDLFFFQMHEHKDRVRLKWGEQFYKNPKEENEDEEGKDKL